VGVRVCRGEKKSPWLRWTKEKKFVCGGRGGGEKGDRKGKGESPTAETKEWGGERVNAPTKRNKKGDVRNGLRGKRGGKERSRKHTGRGRGRGKNSRGLSTGRTSGPI